MNIREKMTGAAESNWLNVSLSADERRTAEFIALIAASIQNRRHAKGYSQKDLARMMGVSQAMISRWENGEENFTIATLAKISAALDMEFQNPFNGAKAV
ncbi:MAG: helix-turn-helix domain-containing protein [Synergistaceae bacterium]|jgi:ribosome-binding protein aMBF1 (putative translation factor)|nr:helix-turn-helix domain-containing protein [Synergistaceae bacterium]